MQVPLTNGSCDSSISPEIDTVLFKAMTDACHSYSNEGITPTFAEFLADVCSALGVTPFEYESRVVQLLTLMWSVAKMSEEDSIGDMVISFEAGCRPGTRTEGELRAQEERLRRAEPQISNDEKLRVWFALYERIGIFVDAEFDS